MGKHKLHRLTKEQIEFLNANPNVKYADEKKISFTYEFRVRIWEAWSKDPGRHAVREVLDRNGLPYEIIGSDRIGHLILCFQSNGKPSGAKNKTYGDPTHGISPRSSEATDRLIETGRFQSSGSGISFSDELKNKIINNYPDKSIDETLAEEDISPEDVGYQMIYRLKKRLDNPRSFEKVVYSDEFIEKYRDNRYVGRLTRKQLKLNDDGHMILGLVKQLDLREALKLLDIDADDIPSATYLRMKNNFRGMDQSGLKHFLDSCNDIGLIRKIAHALQMIIDSTADETRGIVSSLTPPEKKSFCTFINDLAASASIRTCDMLSCCGMARSSYYGILGNDNYAMKEQRDLEDVELIRKVIEYRGFRKGSRTIYMMMKGITGRQFGLSKIRRLMRKFGIATKVRVTKQSHINQLKLLNDMIQPNYLRRMFRLARPGRYLGTDVTYLRCGDGKMRYLSAVKDLSSGRLLSWEVSDCNNLALATDTLTDLKNEKFTGQVFYHTDQGSAYLSPSFQNKVKEMGFIASMSRRGNCWDNSAVESCWGHFKDECDCRSCTSLDELRDLVGRYVDYYNNDRPQWSRNRMTPVQFERHLNEMTDDEYSRYIEKEYDKYQKMISEAGIKARRRAHDIGA